MSKKQKKKEPSTIQEDDVYQALEDVVFNPGFTKDDVRSFLKELTNNLEFLTYCCKRYTRDDFIYLKQRITDMQKK